MKTKGAQTVEEFIERGGNITKIPRGVSGEDYNPISMKYHELNYRSNKNPKKAKVN